MFHELGSLIWTVMQRQTEERGGRLNQQVQ